MLSIIVCDPHPASPQFDFQRITWLGWKGTAIPAGRRLGEWAWVGRVYP